MLHIKKNTTNPPTMKNEHIEKFALDAEKGGFPRYLIPETFDHVLYADEKMLLNPEVWKAVGKTRGWQIVEDHDSYCGKCQCGASINCCEWLHNWHRFIDHLADGKTINDALEAIT